MKEANWRVLRRGVLLFVLLLSFAVRVSGITAQSMWRDEVDALRFSQEPLSTLIGYFTRVGWNGPLFYLLLRPWLSLAGHSELGARYFSLWFGVIGVALLYRLGREWFSPLVGGLVALLMACSPYVVWYAQELKMYALLCALVLGTLYLYRQVLWNGDWRIWVAVVILAWSTAGVHIMGTLLVPVMGLLFWAWWPVARVQWRQALVALAGLALPGALAGPWVLPLLIRGGNIGHQFVSLGAMVATLTNALSRGIVSVGGLGPVGLAVFGLLAGTALGPGFDVVQLWDRDKNANRVSGPKVGRAPRRVDWEMRHVLAVWIWLAVPVLGLFAISLRVPMFVDRYLIWIGPAFYLLVARGLDQVRRRSMALGVLCLVAMLVFNGWGIWEQSSKPIKSDFRAAAAYLGQYRQPGELIFFHISYVRETFEYYYGDSSPTADGVPTDEHTEEAAVDTAMRERTANHPVVWLVLSEPEMWDRRGMTVAWLDEHADEEARADFARVSVVRYRMAQKAP
jgi:mannosyltransferase